MQVTGFSVFARQLTGFARTDLPSVEFILPLQP